MAHECHDREDLLRDARALVPRIQLQAPIAGKVISVFAGFRGEALSIYFGADPVFHFNAQGELRRAHVDGRLVKADGGGLVAMERVPTTVAVELRAERLSDAAQERLLADLVDRLAQLREALGANAVTLEGQVPPDGDALPRLIAWLDQHRRATPAQSPRVA